MQPSVRFPSCLFHLAVILLVLSVAADVRSENLWPGFRGHGNSHVAGKGIPISWELRGRNPGSWTIRLPGYGQSSPVIWQETIFITAVSGDEKDQLHVLAISAADGKIRWQKDFVGTLKVKDSDTVSRGAPTPVVDADRVYAVFESGDIVALTHAGEVSWQKSFVKEFGEIKGPHGYASSPVLTDGLVILQVAHSGPSYVLALDSVTGEMRWKVDHPSQTGWSTPLVIRRGDSTQVIISTSGSVRSLETATGRELWALNDVRGNSTASPTIDGDYILIGASGEQGRGRRGGSDRTDRKNEGESPSQSTPVDNGSPEKPSASIGSFAIQLSDTQNAKLAWNSPKVICGYASPLVLDGLAYFVNRVGGVQCVEVATGDVKWQHRLPGQAWASPIAYEGHLLFFCKEGTVVTLKAGPLLEEVAESQISATDVVYGVAADDQSWIVRTGRGLTRIKGNN